MIGEDMPSAIPRHMDADADEDYLHYLEELQRSPKYFPTHSSQAFAQQPFDNSPSQSSDAHSQHSFDLFSVWPPPVGLRVEKSMRKAKKNIGSKDGLEKACKSGDFTKKEDCEAKKRSYSHRIRENLDSLEI
ncbi:hypothetical protein PIB30_092093 [Stylosanthes scabra]|uniref:Uncharacterized protein n=1 Tax=Stylosanthes scabra TaxID=79078 RepID=A0ABU6TU61_9FABA|nr:hypothetical protein [Stylosanthes scabra]